MKHNLILKAILISLFVLFIIRFLPQVQFDNSMKKWIPEGSAQVKKYQQFLDRFSNDAFIIISFEHTDREMTETDHRLLVQFQKKLQTLPFVKSALRWPAPFFRLKKQPDPNTLNFLVSFSPESYLNPNRPELLEQIEILCSKMPMESHIAGTGVIHREINIETQKSSFTFLAIGLLLLFILLICILKKITAFLLSLSVSIAGICLLFSFAGLCQIPLSIVHIIIPVLVLFYGTSLSLHIFFHKGHFRQVLLPCIIATGTTCIAFIVFLPEPIPLLREFALLTIAGILGELFWALILFYPESIAYNSPATTHKFFRNFPVPSNAIPLILSLCLTLFMCTGAIHVQPNINSLSILPESNKYVQDHYFIENHVGHYIPLEFTIQRDHADPETVQQWIDTVLQFKEVDGVLSYFSFPKFFDPVRFGYLSKDRKIGRITFLIPLLPTTRGKALVDSIHLKTRKLFPQLKPQVTGSGTLYASVADALGKAFLRSLIFAFVLVFLMIGLYLRNMKLFFASFFPNIFPICVIVGIMGWLKIPLDMVTVPIGCLLLSIIVDDTIHFLFWYKKTHNLRTTFQEAGPGIFLTSLVLICGFSVFLTSPSPPVRIFGLLSMTALISALFGDTVLLPIILQCIEKRNHPIKREQP